MKDEMIFVSKERMKWKKACDTSPFGIAKFTVCTGSTYLINSKGDVMYRNRDKQFYFKEITNGDNCYLKHADWKPLDKHSNKIQQEAFIEKTEWSNGRVKRTIMMSVIISLFTIPFLWIWFDDVAEPNVLSTVLSIFVYLFIVEWLRERNPYDGHFSKWIVGEENINAFYERWTP